MGRRMQKVKLDKFRSTFSMGLSSLARMGNYESLPDVTFAYTMIPRSLLDNSNLGFLSFLTFYETRSANTRFMRVFVRAEGAGSALSLTIMEMIITISS